MTTSAIFFKHPAGNCIETADDVDSQLFGEDGDSPIGVDDWIYVVRERDGARVLIPVNNIADVVIGGNRP